MSAGVRFLLVSLLAVVVVGALVMLVVDIVDARSESGDVAHYNAALDALATGDLEAALGASESCDVPRAAFIGGYVAYARAKALEPRAKAPGADPTLLQRTIAYAEDAVAAYRTAASAPGDWPEARRNLERAMLYLDDLREKKKAGRRKPRPKPGDTKPSGGSSRTPEGDPPDDPGKEPDEAIASDELAPEDVVGLFELLRQKEIERRDVRRAARRTAGANVERDW